MEKEKNNVTDTISDETGYINTQELRDILEQNEEVKQECWFKRLLNKIFKKNK